MFRNRTKRNRSSNKNRLWKLSALEPRLMLAADVAADASAQCETATVVFVDPTLADADQLISGIDPSAQVVLLESSDPIAQMSNVLSGMQGVSSVHVISHGIAGALHIGETTIDVESLESRHEMLKRWSDSLTENADILIYGCNAGRGEAGLELMKSLAGLTGADVAASTNLTGSTSGSADWVLERHVGRIDVGLAVNASAREQYAHHLDVVVNAAGTTGQERFRLLIDTQVVGEWTASTQQLSYIYSTNQNITPDQVRVVFINDLFDAANGIDRNLVVDNVVISGTRYESEAPTTFSTGTWNDADGITAGFGRGDTLHSNGYFLYGSGANGSTIEINAFGTEGIEQMQLRINGNAVQTFDVTTSNQTYVYNSSTPVTADQIQIAFLNDVFDPANGIDTDLTVDNIRINGTTYETEASDVFSTGTWVGNGIEPGFGRGDTLHVEGYFQYAGGGNNGSTIEINASGTEGIEQMQLQIDGNAVQTFDVSTSNQTYVYNANSTVTADQVRVVFLNDVFDPANGIDTDLTVDNIRIDGTTYETEASDVFSTGTWVGNGIEPGFGRGDTLHVEGYFQYAAGNSNSGSIRIQSSVINVGEADGTATITVERVGGTDGIATVDYNTVNISAIAGSDYESRSGTLTFQNGQTTRSINVPIINDNNVEGNEQFALTIENAIGADLLAPRTATITIDDNDSILAEGDGLLGEYYNNVNFTSPFITRVDPIVSFDWGQSAPAVGMGSDTFSVRWSGQVEPRFSETYTFYTTTDDGVRLWVNDQLIIDEYRDYAATTFSGQIALEAGQLYDIRMEYYDNTLDASAELRWSSASQAEEVIPQSQLYAAEPTDPGPGDNLQRQNLISGLTRPTSIDFSPDGANMYIAEQRGVVSVVRNGVQQGQFIDISDQVNGVRDRGLLDIAVHPDFENNPYVYMLFTYDPPEVFNHAAGTLQGPDGRGNRAGRLIRVTADASTNYTTAVAGSEVVLLGTNSTWDNFNGFVNSTFDFNEPPAGINPDGSNIRDFVATDSESHTVGGVEFGIDGNLFVSIGDGTSYNQVDPRTVRVQDIDNLSGKILRIDPITGQGVSDNPFYNGDPNANRSKVYQYGLRNPFRISVDDVTGALYIGDVGWTQWEELNSAGPGANFGWPYYEGGDGTNLRTAQYQNLPEAQAFYASGQVATPGIVGLNHAADGINAIVGGDVYRGTAFPSEYQGDVFFNDLGQGILRNVSFDSNGNVSNIETFATGTNVVVQIVTGPDGNLYFVDLDDGQVGRWVFV